MRVGVTGASGFLGRELVEILTAEGHEVIRFVRSGQPQPGQATWNPARGTIDQQAVSSCDAVVHLAGEPIGRRWTPTIKKKIRDSRVDGTELISRAVAAGDSNVKTLVTASAVGYYGNRGDEVLDESSSSGGGFLTDTVIAWENAADSARDAGVRVVNARIGVVLGSAGALPKMLVPFRLGVGGRVGSGQQFMSWVHHADAAGALAFLLTHDGVSGACNVTAPEPATNLAFTKALGRVLRRPTILPVPSFGVSLLLGEMARETVLFSQRAVPAKLEAAGFRFSFREVETALRDILK